MNPKVFLVDENDKKIGLGELEAAHLGRGLKHRAFVTLLFNSHGQVLLQKRKHRLFDGLWDFTAISHPLFFNNHSETYQEASDRALNKEMGIKHVVVKKEGSFSYFAKDGKNCENEYCAILVGSYEGEYRANSLEVYETKWEDFVKFTEDISKNPKKYTPWAVMANKKLKGYGVRNTFEKELSVFLDKFEKFKTDYFLRKRRLYENDKYFQDFWKDLNGFMEGGKKLRGFLVNLGYLAAGGKDAKKTLSICLAYEIAHAFLLMHDDVIDKSDTRRGKPTINKKYSGKYGEDFGKNMAILWGDLAIIESLSIFADSNFDSKIKNKAETFFLRTLFETGLGQTLDVIKTHERASEADIKRVNILKTAKYSICGPLVLGAILAGAGNSLITKLEKFGILAGEAFQLQDDLLGVFGDEKTVGKPVLSDMREGKNTLLILKTREMAKKTDKMLIDGLWGKGSSSMDDLQKVRNAIKESGAYDWSLIKMEKLKSKAISEISGKGFDKEVRQILFEMADFLIKRSF